MLTNLLQNKNVLITGIAGKKSIAYGIAKEMHNAGANIAVTCQSPELVPHITKITSEFNASIVIPCDVADDNSILNMVNTLKLHWDNIDIVVHSIAYCPTDAFAGNFIESTTRDNFKVSHDISSYSLIALTKATMPMLINTSSIIALTYIGSTVVVPGYNVMSLAKASLECGVRNLAYDLGPLGIRVNGLSAGPYYTHATRIGTFIKEHMRIYEKNSLLQRPITIEELANSAILLGSDLSSAITGQIIYADGGYNVVGTK